MNSQNKFFRWFFRFTLLSMTSQTHTHTRIKVILTFSYFFTFVYFFIIRAKCAISYPFSFDLSLSVDAFLSSSTREISHTHIALHGEITSKRRKRLIFAEKWKWLLPFLLIELMLGSSKVKFAKFLWRFRWKREKMYQWLMWCLSESKRFSTFMRYSKF